MKKLGIITFYLIAFAAVSYFLWQYLHAPKTFIISLIISLAIILLLVQSKSRYTAFIGSILVIGHMIRLIGIFIPIYDKKPDIRLRYRRNSTVLRGITGGSSGLQINVTQDERTIVQTNAAAIPSEGIPIYQGNTIATAGSSATPNERVMLTFWDGSSLQIFPQSTVNIEILAPDFASLTGSRIGITLEKGVISTYTLRRTYKPAQQYVKVNNMFFSCDACIVASSGNAGRIVSSAPFSWRSEGGEPIKLGSGSYVFSRNTVTASQNSALTALLNDTTNTAHNRTKIYNEMRHEFITSQWGRSMDTSSLLTYLSKAKMAVVGLVDRTSRERYNSLALYEYLRDGNTDLPDAFIPEKHLYEFNK